jgi:hypothetical protein
MDWKRLLLALSIVAIAVPAALAAGLTFRGSIGADDPIQRGQLVRDDPGTTCAAPTAAASGDSVPTHYEVYGFRNSTGSTQCVTVDLALDPLLCPGSNPLQSAAYAPRFESADITANYLADIGASPEAAKSYSFDVAAHADFDVTVNETNPGAGCNSYTLTVTGSGIVIRGTTAVGVLYFTATTGRKGILLRWRVAAGPQTLGFNVYREHSGRRIRLNRSLIEAGGAGTHIYTWLDRRAPSAASRYWLQELGRNGSRSWRGPAVAR